MTLTLWTSTGIAQPFHDVWAAFEKATGVKIDYIAVPDPFEDSLMAKWVAGDRPDILGFHGDVTWLQKLQPATNLVDLSNEAFVAKTKFNLLDFAGKVDGKVYAAFTAYPAVAGAYYNTEVFQRLGLTPPTDWAGLRALCDKIKAADKSVTPIVTGTGAQWPLYFFGSSYMSDEMKAGIVTDINSGKINFTDPRVLAEFQMMVDMRNQGCFEKDLGTTQYEDQTARLFKGTAAIAFSGTFILDDLNASYGMDTVAKKIGFFPISANDQTASWTVVQAGTYQIPVNKDPAKQAAAMAFLRYVTGDGFQVYLDASGDLPIFEGYAAPAKVTEVRKQVDKALQGGSVPQYSTGLTYTPGQYHIWMNEMLTGGKTPLQVGQAMQDAWDAAKAAAGH
ncbi:MAG: extracellular solute-binding protein [Chloroflexota bacterium]|nr:extracellular solute-binding protein [Chloroflexota bacterium]